MTDSTRRRPRVEKWHITFRQLLKVTVSGCLRGYYFVNKRPKLPSVLSKAPSFVLALWCFSCQVFFFLGWGCWGLWGGILVQTWTLAEEIRNVKAKIDVKVKLRRRNGRLKWLKRPCVTSRPRGKREAETCRYLETPGGRLTCLLTTDWPLSWEVLNRVSWRGR